VDLPRDRVQISSVSRSISADMAVASSTGLLATSTHTTRFHPECANSRPISKAHGSPAELISRGGHCGRPLPQPALRATLSPALLVQAGASAPIVSSVNIMTSSGVAVFRRYPDRLEGVASALEEISLRADLLDLSTSRQIAANLISSSLHALGMLCSKMPHHASSRNARLSTLQFGSSGSSSRKSHRSVPCRLEFLASWSSNASLSATPYATTNAHRNVCVPGT